MSRSASTVFLPDRSEAARRPSRRPARRLWAESAATVVLLLAAGALTVLLVGFLGALQLRDVSSSPFLSLRSMDSAQAPAGSAAPPPPPAQSSSAESPDTPTPPQIVELPSLSFDVADSSVPAIKAQLSTGMDFKIQPQQFVSTTGEYGMGDGSGSGTGDSFGQGLARGSMTFGVAELDSQPRLVSRPSVAYPAAQLRRGVPEGHVTLEVLINSSGRVTVKRVLSSSHEDFTAMARSFATRARFTPPQKDGRPVNAVFRWPLILKP